MKFPTTKAFEKIVLEEIPLIDVRAPIEFEKGAFKNAVNLPLMTDEERHLVGICYAEKGNEEAVKLGHRLVSGDIREARIQAWKEHLDQYPNSLIYCFRGGLRSQISQEWITEATGKSIERLEGGYKAFRTYLLQAFEISEQKSLPIVVGGCTGTGKTRLLEKLESAIDLEGLANHRGSSFGRQISPQPSQINFENHLAYALIQHRHQGHRHLFVEDEGKNIGRCMVPKSLVAYFDSSDLVVIEAPFEERVLNTLKEYVVDSQAAYAKAFGQEQGFNEWTSYIKESMNRLKNRLGGDRMNQLLNYFEQAIHVQVNSEDLELHQNWIAMLLKEYYDPMYQYQLENTKRKIIFKGTSKDAEEFLRSEDKKEY